MMSGVSDSMHVQRVSQLEVDVAVDGGWHLKQQR